VLLVSKMKILSSNGEKENIDEMAVHLLSMNTFLMKYLYFTIKSTLGRLPFVQAFWKLPLQHAATICHHAHVPHSLIPSFHLLDIVMEHFPLFFTNGSNIRGKLFQKRV
jgi:hypothetical protein